MLNDNKILALILARCGSKGLPGKNIKPLLGKPLIAWTIEQAKESKYVDKVIVSTDDGEIASISRKYGAEVPFIRPKELAGDKSKSVDAVLHAIEWMKENRWSYDIIVWLQVTSALRTAEDIDKAVELLFRKNAEAVVSVCQADHHPYWSNILPDTNCMIDFVRPEAANKNRQDLPVFYRLNGAIYLFYTDYFKSHKSFYESNTFAYIMPKERSVDIDNETDFELVKILMSGAYREE